MSDRTPPFIQRWCGTAYLKPPKHYDSENISLCRLSLSIGDLSAVYREDRGQVLSMFRVLTSFRVVEGNCQYANGKYTIGMILLTGGGYL